jgi:hypothetical protein
MGMFDSIYLEMKCPFCGKISEMEIQTKELDCDLNVWKVGDYIGTDKYNYIDECSAQCRSDECMDFMLKKQGYRSGFGRSFDVKIFLNEGFVTGAYEIINNKEDNE